jgi:tetratricopeptide (TPR) repeat protein
MQPEGCPKVLRTTTPRKSLAERADLHDQLDGRVFWTLLTDKAFAGLSYTEASDLIRSAGGPHWGTGDEALKAIHEKRYRVRGLAIAAIQSFWDTSSGIAFSSRIVERLLREAFFGKIDYSLETAIRFAESVQLGNTARLKFEKPIFELDKASNILLNGQIHMYKARFFKENSHFNMAIDEFERCYDICFQHEDPININKSNVTFCLMAATCVANIAYSMAKTDGINSGRLKEKAKKLMTSNRLLTAIRLAESVKDPRISANHSEIALLAGNRQSAIELMKLTIKIQPGKQSELLKGMWDKPNWLSPDDPELAEMQEIIKEAAKSYTKKR